MADKKRPYDSTVARIAGNILSGALIPAGDMPDAATYAVKLARAIVSETIRTEPKEDSNG